MYAPTFRSLDEIENYGFDVCNLLKALHAKFGGDWKLLLRFHPNVASLSLPNMFAKCQNSMMINVTSYDDMQDLLCAADVLITDFSSVSTEFFIQKNRVSYMLQILIPTLEDCILNPIRCHSLLRKLSTS